MASPDIVSESLYEQWIAHCKEVGHRPHSDGGGATYVMTIPQRRIECEARISVRDGDGQRSARCQWAKEREE